MKTGSQTANTFDFLGYQEIVLGRPEWFYTVVTIAVLLAIFTLWSYRRSTMPLNWKVLAVGLRLAGIALLLACLLEPMGSLQRPKSQANVFAVVMDNSPLVLVETARDLGKTELPFDKN